VSWLNDLVDRRRRQTGESFQTAAELLRLGVAGLPLIERSRLRAAAQEHVVPAPFGADPGLPSELRAALLPDAVTRPQIELEACLLHAVSRSVDHLHNHPEGRLTRPAVVVRSVTPLPDRLQLRLDPLAVAPLLYEAMPFEFDEEVSGITGLRVRQHRRSVELFLVDFPDACVELLGVDGTAWRAAAAYRQVRNRDAGGGSCLASAASDRLAPAEVRSLAAYGRAFGPAEIASGLLRRIAVLRDTLWIQTWAMGCAAFNVEWPGNDPRRAHVALVWADPLFGLPGAEIEAPTVLKFPASSSSCRGRNLCDSHQLRLRFTTLPQVNSESETLLASLRDCARPEWDAWHAAKGGMPAIDGSLLP
jgi:hypothetical protein